MNDALQDDRPVQEDAVVPREARAGAAVAQVHPGHSDACLPDDVRTRIELAGARAAAQLADLPENPRAPQLLNAARGARSARQRVVWLQRWGSAWAEPLAQVAACRRGCSHCCSLPVAITSAEARLIGEAVGREPASPRQPFG